MGESAQLLGGAQGLNKLPKVVDENVLVVANDLTRLSRGLIAISPQVSGECQLACVTFIEELMTNDTIVIDDGTLFLEKYKSHCSFSGQPGIGDAFLRAVFERGYSNDWVTRVTIVDGEGFRLPAAFLGCGFDNDDMLWIAAAFNGPLDTMVANACDSDYQDFEATIAGIGVAVLEICN